MLEKGHRDFEYIFFNKVATEHKEFHGQIDKLYLNQIFDVKHDILFDSERLGKHDIGCMEVYKFMPNGINTFYQICR